MGKPQDKYWTRCVLRRCKEKKTIRQTNQTTALQPATRGRFFCFTFGNLSSSMFSVQTLVRLERSAVPGKRKRPGFMVHQRHIPGWLFFEALCVTFCEASSLSLWRSFVLWQQLTSNYASYLRTSIRSSLGSGLKECGGRGGNRSLQSHQGLGFLWHRPLLAQLTCQFRFEPASCTPTTPQHAVPAAADNRRSQLILKGGEFNQPACWEQVGEKSEQFNRVPTGTL